MKIIMNDNFTKFKKSAGLFIKTGIISLFVGLICGIVGVAFHLAVDFVTEFRGENPWVLYTLPVLGAVIAFMYAKFNPGDKGTDGIFVAAENGDKLPIAIAPTIFIGTVLTHLGGGSSGREGAALQLGGSIASNIASLLKLPKSMVNGMILAGMAAVFSALFGTPITAFVFVLEVITVGCINTFAVLPCIISSLSAYRLAVNLGVTPMRYNILSAIPTAFDPVTAVKIAILALFCAIVSVAFCLLMHNAHHIYQKTFKNPYIRRAAGGLVVIALTLIFGTDYNGAGMGVVNGIMAGGTVAIYAFLLKMIFTGATLGAGFKGGEIVPAMFIGASFGAVAAPFIGLNSVFGGAIGLVCVFCGAVNAPLTAIILSREMFGSSAMAYFALAVVVCFVASGKTSLYSVQTNLYSRLEKKAED